MSHVDGGMNDSHLHLAELEAVQTKRNSGFFGTQEAVSPNFTPVMTNRVSVPCKTPPKIPLGCILPCPACKADVP